MNYVDYENETGEIKNYEVSLKRCTCTDFQRRHKPCKHMYCLAVELGVFEIDEGDFTETNEKNNSGDIIRYPISYEYSMYGAPPKNFVVIDFETANAKPDSICQLGIAVVEDHKIIERRRFFIRPPYDDFSNSRIHGITLGDVQNEPNFGELWAQIKPYVRGHPIAAYNLPFDLGCLLASLERYKISDTGLEAFDILANVRHYSSEGISSYKLENVARALGIEHNPHEALSDAGAAAEIQIYCSGRFPDESIAIHFAGVAAICDVIAKSRMPLDAVIDYGKGLIRSDRQLNYDDYKTFLKLIEQTAAVKDNAPLYKICGTMYENFGFAKRALFLYKKALGLDSGMKLKTRIQKLERELRKTI